MRRFGFILLALAAVAVLALGALSIARDALDPFTYDPVAEARRAAALAELDRQQAQAEALAPVDLFVGAMWRLLPLVAAVAALGYLATLGGVALARFRRLARPDERGLLPVELAELGHYSGQALGGYHAARLAEAQRQPVPHTYAPHVTYSPHSAPRLDYRADAGGVPLLPADVAAAAGPVEVPSFAQLLDAGRIGRGNPMLLGFDAGTGAAVEGSWLDLYSCGLGGLSGSGKSWTACYLTAQAVLFGSRVVLLDPHAGHAESLAQRLAPLAGQFVCAPAESPREMLAAVELVAEELRQRKAGKRGEPLLFIADEYSALQRGELAEPLAALVEALGQEGRKLQMFAMVAGQIWSASRAGGTEVRDSLASAFVHRCRPAQARYLTGLTAADLPPDLLDLPSGTAYLLNTAGDFHKVTIPRLAAGDVGRVAGLLGDGAGSMVDLGRPRAAGRAATPSTAPLVTPAWPGAGPAVARATESGASASGRAAPLPAEAAALLARFTAGATVHDLAGELAGTANPSDRRYKAARQQVEAALRAATARALGAPTEAM